MSTCFLFWYQMATLITMGTMETTQQKEGTGHLVLTPSEPHQAEASPNPQTVGRSATSHPMKGDSVTSPQVLSRAICSKEARNAYAHPIFLAKSENTNIRVQTKHFLPCLLTPAADFSTASVKFIHLNLLRWPWTVHSY